MDWHELLRDPPWWLKTCLGFGGTLVGFALLRSAFMIWQVGFLNYLKSTFRADPRFLLIIGILLFIAIASAASLIIPGGTPWRWVP